MTTRPRDALSYALEHVYGGEQSVEAECVLDHLGDIGFEVREAPRLASTAGMAKRAHP